MFEQQAMTSKRPSSNHCATRSLPRLDKHSHLMKCQDGTWENLGISSTPGHTDIRIVLRELNDRLDKTLAVPANLNPSEAKYTVDKVEQDYILCTQKAEDQMDSYIALGQSCQSSFAEVLAICQFECKWVDLIHAEFENHLGSLCLEHWQLSHNIRKRTASIFQRLITLVFSALDTSNAYTEGQQESYQAKALDSNFSQEVSESLESFNEKDEPDYAQQLPEKTNIQAKQIEYNDSDREQCARALSYVHDVCKRDNDDSNTGESHDRIKHLERELTDARQSVDEITRSADRKLANLEGLLTHEREMISVLQLQVKDLSKTEADSPISTTTDATSKFKPCSSASSESIQQGSPESELDAGLDDLNDRKGTEIHDTKNCAHEGTPSLLVKPGLVSRRKATFRDDRCLAFRILLPNFGGERPIRSDVWVRCCMRAIVFAKAFEDRQRAFQTRFPDFVYAFFNPGANGDCSGSEDKAHNDCWGFYDGILRLASPEVHSTEAQLFMNYLSEEHGRDYNRFALHAVDTLRSYVDVSIPATITWVAQVDEMCLHESIPRAYTHEELYVEIQHVIKASRLILAQLDASTRQEVIQQIRYLSKEAPFVEGQKSAHGDKLIDIFEWLQLIMNLFLQEQNLRRAVLRLMFETCHLGILTSVQMAPSDVGHEEAQSKDNLSKYYKSAPPGFIDFSQFTAIVHTMQPNMDLAEVASFYRRAHEASSGQINFKTFLAIGEEIDFFSSSLKLSRPVNATSSDELPLRVRYQIGASCHLHLELIQPILQKIGTKLSAGRRHNLLRLEDDLRFALEVATKGLAIDGMSPLTAYRRLMLFVLSARIDLCEDNIEQKDSAWAALYAEREMDALEGIAFGLNPPTEYRKVSAMKRSFALEKIKAAILKWHRRPSRRPSWLKSIERNRRETRRLSMNIRNLVGMESLTEGDT